MQGKRKGKVMKAKELKIGVVLGFILLLGLVDFAEATTIEDDWWNESSILSDNSNSIVIDNIEYYIQTDKSTYNMGEDVNMLHRVTNMGDQDVTIQCNRIPQFNFRVKKNGNDIWSRYHFFLTKLSYIEIPVGSFIEKTFTWDMYNDNDYLIGPGIYDVVGVMYNSNTEVSVPITVIPEPVSLVLLMTGSFVLIRKKRGKRI